jgi:putative flippase GtrA
MSRQLLRFLIVGCVNVLVTFIVFVFCYRHLQLGPLVLDAIGPLHDWLAGSLGRGGDASIDAAVANSVGYLAGMINSFLLNKFWTFGARGKTLVQARRFLALNLTSLAASTAVVFVLVDVLRAPYLHVFVATVAATTALHYFANRHWTFAVAEERRSAETEARAR